MLTKLKKALPSIANEKSKIWRIFVHSFTAWGKPYKIIMNKNKILSFPFLESDEGDTLITENTEKYKLILKTLFLCIKHTNFEQSPENDHNLKIEQTLLIKPHS